MAPQKRSTVWKFFEKIDSHVVKCKLCKRDLRFNNSTSNMKAHLRCKDHSHLNFDEIDANDFHIENVASNVTAITSTPAGSTEAVETSTRLNLESQVFNYEKLVVPMSMRSVYWKFYGFPASENGEILTNLKIVCILCKNVISYNRNTSNLRMHLQNKHREELIQIERTLPQKNEESALQKEQKFRRKRKEGFIYSTDVSGSVVIGDRSHSHLNNEDYEASSHLRNSENSDVRLYGCKGESVVTSTPKQSQVNVLMSGAEQSCTIESLHPFMIPIESKSVSDAVTEFIIMDMQLPDIVEGRGFQRLIATLKSPCEIPSRSKLIEEIVPRTYDNVKESVQQTLQNINADITLSAEEWESTSGGNYVTFSITYQQDREESLVNKVLTTVQCPISNDNMFWELVFNNLVEDWSIKLDKMKVFVCASSRQDLLDVFTQRGLIVVPCLIHTLQDVCTSVCLDQDDVHEILWKARTLIHLIYKHNNALAALRIQDHLMTLDDAPLMSDYPRLWLTTYNMLEALLARRLVISTILDNIEPSAFDKEAVTVTEQEWALIEDIVTVLEAFKVTMLTLSEERTPLVSLLKPLLCQLLNTHLKQKDDDSLNLQVFKGSLKASLAEKYSEPELDLFLTISTTLDPRFKSLANMAEESKACLDGPIKESLTKLIEQSPAKDMKPIIDDEPDKKKAKLGMVMMLGEMCPSSVPAVAMSEVERSSLELIQYKSEATATLDQCPMAWWNLVISKCPNLARLASQYTFVPAAATPPCRIALDAQLAYETKRANLVPEITDRILFLNSNHVL